MKKLKLNIQMFASTNKTANYDLPQFVGTDKPTWLGDINQAMADIDAGMHENATNISSMASDVATASATASQASQDVSALTSTVNTLSSDVTAVTTTANNAQQTATSALNTANTANGNIGNLSQLVTTDKTSVVNSINEVKTNSDTFETTITNYLTLSDNRNLSNPTTSSGTTAGNTMRIALNNTGSLGKIYGNINVNGASSNPVIKFTNTGIQTDTQFEINNCGFVRRGGDNLVEQANIRVIPANTSLGETSASIELFTGLAPNGNSLFFKFIPCILFFSDFGD